MAGRQAGFWDVEHRLRQLSERGDPLEKLAATVDFEIFRAELVAALGPRDRAKGGRPPFDPVLKFRMLVLQAMHGLSLAQTEFLVADRLSWMRFCGLGPGRRRAGRQHAVGFPRGADRGGRAGCAVRAARPGDHRGGLSADGGPDRRRHAGGRAPPAQHRRREGADQGRREGRRHLARQAGQGAPEGHRCALDDEVLQGEARRRRQAADRHRDPGLRLQEPHLDRPAARHHPPGEGHRRGGP